MKNCKNAKKILEIEKLSLYAPDSGAKILKSISWSINSGERWVLLGANGAGKSSLISAICGYSMPAECLLRVAGLEYSKDNWREVRERIALVGTHLHRGINGGEKVVDVIISGKFAMINYWGRITRQLVLEAYSKMRQLGIAHLIDSEWRHISQGEREKVLIARSLMTKPDVVILDEPCSALDPVARRNFVRFLDRIGRHKTPHAMILATHYIGEIPPCFTHALVLRRGSVMAAGEIGKVVNSETLSKAYGAECKVSRRNGMFSFALA